jgi:hypothetical protein
MAFLSFWPAISSKLIEKTTSFVMSSIGYLLVKFDQSKIVKIQSPFYTPAISVNSSTTSMLDSNTTTVSNISLRYTEMDIGVLKVDALYLATLFFVLIGILWLSLTKNIMKRLQSLDSNEWKVTN